MNIFDALTVEDKRKIDDYRTMFATAYSEDYGERARIGEKCSVDYLLRYWASNKQGLFELFGEKLIIEKPIQYSLSVEEIARQMRDMLLYQENIFDIRDTGVITRAHDFFMFLRNKVHSYDWNSVEKDVLYTVVNFDYLAENRWPTDNVACFGTKIQKGMKMIKVIEKIAKYFNVDGFEDFRIVHSLGLNNKKTSGTLCLSIHPLDYMTMSDNQSGWSSCMSWMQDGCYRQGTVEMMNSEKVVVAYIKSDDVADYCGVEWNDKKWRQLIIVDPKIITGVKAYPYFNTNITSMCIDELRKLFPEDAYCLKSVVMEDAGVAQSYIVNFAGEEKKLKDVYFNFNTGYMYNDFSSVCSFPVYLGNGIENYSRNYIDYSGTSECMWCGNNYNDDASDSLLCTDCYEYESPYCYCDMCGDSISDEESCYELDGNYYCYDCYNDIVVEADNDGCEHDFHNCCQMMIKMPDGRLEWVSNGNERTYFYINRSELRALLRTFITYEIKTFSTHYSLSRYNQYYYSLRGNVIIVDYNDKVQEYLDDNDFELDDGYYNIDATSTYDVNEILNQV